MKRLNTDQRGVAMVTALLVTMIVAVFAATAIQLANHNEDLSSYDRKRLQSINAAEAGINYTYSVIQASTRATLPCTLDGDVTTTPPAHYHVAVTYYPSWPATGTPLTCTAGSGVPSTPGGALLVSVGTAVTGSTRAVRRQMESLVRLVLGTQGGLGIDAVIYARQDITDTNAFTVGNNGNDANIYAGGNWTCTNGSNVAGSVYVQGSVTTTGTCSSAADLWANNSISLNGFTLGHDLTSSTSSINLQGSTYVSHNVKAGTSCTGCTTGAGGRVGGTVTTNSTSGPPPYPPFPQLTWNPTDWSNAGYQIAEYPSDCTGAKNFFQDTGSPAQNWVVHVTGTCVFQGTSTVTLRGDLALFTDGAINITNAITYQSAVPGVRHVLRMIVGYADPTACSPSKIIKYTNTMTFVDVDAFFYTPCDLSVTNKAFGLYGQMLGKNVTITNQFSITYKQLDVPGFGGGTGGFNVDIAFIRETKVS